MMGYQVRLALECLGIGIPDLDDVVTCFRTDRESVDDIPAVLGNLFEHCGKSIADKGGAGLVLKNTEGVGPAIDIIVVFPEGGNIIAHKEEHSVTQGFGLEFFNNRKVLAPGLHWPKGREGWEGPVAPLRRVVEEGPGARWNWCIKCIN